MKKSLVLLILIVCYHFSLAIIIRHDINPNLVIIKGNEFQGVLQMSLQDKVGIVRFEGTMIRDNWIVTCAHFADEGIIPNQSLEILGNQYEIDSILIHPDYEGWENDVALIRLKRPVSDVSFYHFMTRKLVPAN